MENLRVVFYSHQKSLEKKNAKFVNYFNILTLPGGLLGLLPHSPITGR